MKKSIMAAALMATSFAARFNAAITPTSMPMLADAPMPSGSRSRYRGAGKPQPAGSKLARMAKEGRLGSMRPESIVARNQREALVRRAR